MKNIVEAHIFALLNVNKVKTNVYIVITFLQP